MSKSEDNMSMSLFDMMEESDVDITPRIEVVKLKFDRSELVSWRELFSGFDSIRAITFSSGIGFVGELLDMFSEAEIIFGCENVMSLGLKEIMAYQDTLLERIRSNQRGIKEKMITRIVEGSAHFYVADKISSHEKIYILKSDDGRKRVIMGSANMSYNAFVGKQRENISYLDDDEAYEYYLGIFEDLKRDSVDEISKKALQSSDLCEGIDNLPISERTMQGVVVIENSEEDDVRFTLDVKKKAERLAPLIPKQDKSHRQLISAEVIKKIRRACISEKQREEELRGEYPQLKISIPEKMVTLNDKALDLNPTKEDIRSDVEQFIKYMNGYSKFHGDVLGMQFRYYEFANWFFCSPFMAVMRDYAARFDQNTLPYPVFGLLCGQSKAGKTKFLETLLKMMIGQKPKMSAPDFTRSSIDNIKNQVMGVPIIVDDMTNTRFSQHAIETIKNDDFGLANHFINYSAVVISANEDVKAVAPEIIRRTIICRAEAGLTNTEVMKSNIVRSVQQRVGTAFYREYLRRMIDVADGLIAEIKEEASECAPDILHCSSEVLMEIISEYVTELPVYVRELSLDNYFSEKVTGKYSIKIVKDAWKASPGSFRINKKANELLYNAGTPYEADGIMKELPENLEARKARDWIVMNLDEATRFFEINFRSRLKVWNRN